MKIYVGSDHNGFYLKDHILKYLKGLGYSVEDRGDKKLDPDDDFPVFATQVVSAVLSSDDPDPRGILICGSGQGMCMAANRFKGIRASLVWSVNQARASRNDDDSNVLCLPSATLSEKDIDVIIHTWLSTSFANAPRFKRRISEMDKFGS